MLRRAAGIRALTNVGQQVRFAATTNGGRRGDAQTVLITGSSSGIGQGIAVAFAKKGYNVALHGLEADGTQAAEQLAREYGVRTTFSRADMSKPEEVRQMVWDTEKYFGAVDVLINNAGTQFVKPLKEFPDEMWDKLIAVNLSSVFHACKAVWPGMEARKFGRIINVASVHGLRSSPYKAAYVAAKHGVVGLTKTLAQEGGPHGITANAICPGYVSTPLVTKQIHDWMRIQNKTEEQVTNEIFLKDAYVKEFVQIDELANLAVLMADPTSRTLTGTQITVDAGWTSH